MSTNGRVSLAERALQIHLVRDPSLAPAVGEAIDSDKLHEDTARIIGVAKEFPAACRLAGLLSVAASIHSPIDFLESVEELSNLPDWFLSELPTLEAAVLELSKPRLIPEAGALHQWQREVGAGKRTRYYADPLYEAACLEARARDEIRDGMIGAANDDRRKAAGIIIEAAVAERAS